MSEKTLKTRIIHAVKTESEWTSTNPVLKLGEIGYVSDDNNPNYGRYKVGDGTKHWNELNYADKGIYDKVDEIEIGGRNYITNSDDLTKFNKESGVTVVQDGDYYKVSTGSRTSSRWGIYLDIPVEPNTTYSFSVYVKPGSKSASLGGGPGTGWGSNFGTYSKECRPVYIINTGENSNWRIYLNIYPTEQDDYAYFKLPKLEKGNKATDWTPAPEDKADTVHTHSASDITSGTLSSSRLPIVPVSKGGTGLTTITSGQVLVGNGTDNVTTRAIDTTSGGTSGSTSLITSGSVYSGLSGKANTGHTHDDRYYTESEINTKLDAKLNTSLKGTANGLAELDSTGRVPSNQLPSYVDDVIEGYFYNSKFYKESAHTTEITGETGKIYVDLTSNKTYRWSGSAFSVISETLALGETSSTAYRGDRGKIAYDHSQAAHAPSNAEVNQNAFSNVTVGSTTIAADSKTDTLTLVAGSNVTLTPDATNDKITISSTDTNDKVTQTAVTDSDYTNWRSLIWGASNSGTEGFAPTTVTDGVYSCTGLSVQPSSGTIRANVFKGNLSGNATTASKWAIPRTLSLTGAVTGSASIDGSGDVSLSTSVNHTHNYAGSDSAGGSATSARSLLSQGMLDTQEKIDNFITPNKLQYSLFKTNDTNNIGMATNDGMLLSIPWSSTGYGAQIAIDDSTTGTIKIRGKSNNWGSWYTLLHSGNYTNYTVTKTGSGASGTWGINITGSAGSVEWGNITGKPSVFTPADHTHISLKSNTDNRSTDTTPNDYNSVLKISGLKNNSTIGISNHGSYSGVLGMRPWSEKSGGNSHEFALTQDGEIFHRHGETTSWNSWRQIAFTSSNVASANKLATARTISLTGSVTGSGTFDGSGDLTITTTTNHTHNYLPISGGTMTGQIQKSGVSSAWINGRSNAMIRMNSISGYSPFASIKTTNGSWEIGAYDSPGYIDDLVFSYCTDENFNAGNNSTTSEIKFFNNGHILGNLDGNASTATSATKLNNITTSDEALSTDTWRRVWFSYDDNTTGRPAYSNNLCYQSSTGSLKATTFIENGTALSNKYVSLSGNSTVNGAITFGKSDNYGIRTNTNNYGRIGDSTNQFYEVYSYQIYEDKTLLSNKYAPISHSHNYIVGSYTGDGGQQQPNYFGTNKVGFLMMDTVVNGNYNYKDWIIMDCYGGSDVGGCVAFGVNRQTLGAYIMRSGADRTSWSESAELLHTSNYQSYCAPVSHTHSYLPLSGGTMNGSIKFNSNSLPSKSLEFICGIDAFDSGGEMGWQSKSTFLSDCSKIGHTHNYAGSSSAGGAANYLSVQQGNEINFTNATPVTDLWFNYRNADNGSTSNDTAITTYKFGNKNGSTSGVTLFADSFTGNSASASRLATARTISLTGSVTGSGTFDGSGDLTISTTVSHTHNYAGSTSEGGAANVALGLSPYTISNIDELNSFLSDNFIMKYAKASNCDIGWGSNDGLIISLPWSSTFGAQIAIDDQSNWMGFRSKNNGTWNSWSVLLSSTNYTSYVPTKTGSGASGTWGISITGNATSATKATQDSAGQQINTTYIKGLSVSGKTITYTKGDGSTGTITTQDTTYSVATTSANGLMASSDKSKLNGIPSPTTSDNDKILSVVNGAYSLITVTNAEGVKY